MGVACVQENHGCVIKQSEEPSPQTPVKLECLTSALI